MCHDASALFRAFEAAISPVLRAFTDRIRSRSFLHASQIHPDAFAPPNASRKSTPTDFQAWMMTVWVIIRHVNESVHPAAAEIVRQRLAYRDDTGRCHERSWAKVAGSVGLTPETCKEHYRAAVVQFAFAFASRHISREIAEEQAA